MKEKVVAAGIFIIRKDKKLLVCHPTNHKANFFSIPKGKVEEGETTFDGALRETHEETNLWLGDTPDFDIYELQPVMYKHGKKVLYPFILIEKDNSKMDWDEADIKCNSNVQKDRGNFPEMDGYLWTSITEAKELLHETQVFCLSKIEEIINK